MSSDFSDLIIDDFSDKPHIKKKVEKKDRSAMQSARVKATQYRRAFSETQLLDLTMTIEKDTVYNFITSGDIDALSFLKLILRQQNLDYVLLSTWVMAKEDVFQLGEWLKSGKIKKLDAYVGEIFRKTYPVEYDMLTNIQEEYEGKIVTFRNHSKIFAGYGKEFYFGIQTSANINTNPRTENACIQTGRDIFDFYYSYFNNIEGF